MLKRAMLPLAALVALACSVQAADVTTSLEPGKVELTSAGPLAFGPDGLLLISDPMAATIYAVATGDTAGNPSAVKPNVPDVRGQIASLLGTDTKDILINDLAVNPASGNVYLSVTRGSGPDAAAVILRMDASGKIAEFALDDVRCSSAVLPNAPASQETRRGNARAMSITDLAYVDGRVFVAGLSNEEFASKLRSIPFPFDKAPSGTSVEIYHGAHGRFETASPVRTFTHYSIDGQPYLLAGYQCTPLVKFPVSQLKAGERLRGTTVAELGNGNRPLDMFVYEKDGRDYILLANNVRGVMKIATENIGQIEGITERVGGGGTAGLTYDTIKELAGVMQLDRLNKTSAVVLVRSDDGVESLKTVDLP